MASQFPWEVPDVPRVPELRGTPPGRDAVRAGLCPHTAADPDA